MAAAAAAVDPTLEAAFQASCEAVAGLSVAVLDEKQAERDWHRWLQALLDAVATRPMFKAELEFTGALTAVVTLTAAQLASDDLAVVSAAGPSLRQRRQLALRALINNSLLEGGDARELIKDCPFASGAIGGVPQAFATRRRRRGARASEFGWAANTAQRRTGNGANRVSSFLGMANASGRTGPDTAR